ncbi:helix-turn-helix domain-containing protein [Mycobacterium intracellulare]|uniref:helix-turn-helix domain-containing protein n=1 Tax=Mycobacterium intracellulare TaxID=1767 RepID=UPI001CDB3C9A|nr:helix-turn-helix domain-containing protein [Mycobacterium intracellulare]MCA2253862.1 helix-turn-helix domain-containing protein [Mycobacterium intracellulare]
MSHREPGAITFTAAEVELLHHAVRDYLVRGVTGNRSLPDEYRPLHARLVSFIRETKTCAPQPLSAPSAVEELIDTAEAAAILRRSEQWVRRIRDQLGGRKVGGQCVFRRQTVVEYAERKAGQHK